MGQPVVHFEVVGRDGEKLQSYYAELFDWDVNAENEMKYGLVDREANSNAEGIGLGGGIGQGPDGYEGHVTFYVEVPNVIEPAAGADRATLAFLVDAYEVEEVEGRQRTVLRLHPRLAPNKAAVLPLVSKDGLPEKARPIFEELRTRMPTEFDEGGSIGKRYRRQDEIGTPWGVTIDHQTTQDRTVTLRDRDSLEQERIAIDDLPGEIARRLAEPWTTPKLSA